MHLAVASQNGNTKKLPFLLVSPTFELKGDFSFLCILAYNWYVVSWLVQKKLIKRRWLFRSVHPVSFGLIEHMNPFTKEFSKTPAAVLVLNFHYQCKFHGHFAKLWREDSTLSDFLCLSKEITLVPVISGHYILNRSQFVHHMIKEYLAEVINIHVTV